MKKPSSVQMNETVVVYLIAAILFIVIMAASYLQWFS